MGLSSNQARFLSLTSRQIDLEQRVQQICQRRLRLSSELENVATQYNNSISNRKLFIPTQNSLQNLSLENLEKLGYKVINTQMHNLITKPISTFGYTPISEATAIANGYDANHIIHNANEFVLKITNDLGGNFILTSNVDMSELGTLTTSAIDSAFTGNFDGNGYAINNMVIDTGGAAINNIGLFRSISTGASVSNLAINTSINATGSSDVGAVSGNNTGTISNVHVSGDIIGGTNFVGGITGYSVATGSIINTSSSANITGGNFKVGGLTGESSGIISGSYSTGDVTAARRVGGLVGYTSGGTITNSYSTGDVTGTQELGGLVGYNGSATITSSYATGNVIGGGANRGGFVGLNTSSADNTNFYKNNMSTTGGTAVDANVSPIPTGSWDTNIWDLSEEFPQLQNMQIPSEPTAEEIEQRLRNGEYSLVSYADEFTQSPINIEGDDYEERDWRTIPELNDELFKADDVNAENKYDKTIAEINSQDKKLQLEQSSVEVEYKAISSEKEAVKKILDTNSQSSFKYFG